MDKYHDIEWAKQIADRRIEEETGEREPFDKPVFDDVDEDDDS